MIKDMYAVMLNKTQKDASFKTKWEKVFNEIINWKEVWRTINSGLIEIYYYF